MAVMPTVEKHVVITVLLTITCGLDGPSIVVYVDFLKRYWKWKFVGSLVSIPTAISFCCKDFDTLPSRISLLTQPIGSASLVTIKPRVTCQLTISCCNGISQDFSRL